MKGKLKEYLLTSIDILYEELTLNQGLTDEERKIDRAVLDVLLKIKEICVKRNKY